MLDHNHHDFISTCLKHKDYQANPIAGDASNRQYFRIISKDNSYVLMLWEPFEDIDSYPFLNVQKYFEKAKIHVPEVIGLSAEEGLVLLEDLGDLTLERKFWEFQNQEYVIPHYKQAIDELIKIHFHVKDKKCIAFDIAFDHEKLLWEMNYGKKHLLVELCKSNFDDKALDKEFQQICAHLDQQPRRLCHRDYHSRNLMIKRGKMRVIDFQDARMGPIQYDLVSLFHDSYVKLSDVSINSLTDYYLEQASEYLPSDFSKEEFFKIFELQLIQRCFKACGSFSSFFNSREDRRYLKYLKPTINKVFDKLKSNNDFPHFTKTLEDSGALEKNYLEL